MWEITLFSTCSKRHLLLTFGHVYLRDVSLSSCENHKSYIESKNYDQAPHLSLFPSSRGCNSKLLKIAVYVIASVKTCCIKWSVF